MKSNRLHLLQRMIHLDPGETQVIENGLGTQDIIVALYQFTEGVEVDIKIKIINLYSISLTLSSTSPQQIGVVILEL